MTIVRWREQGFVFELSSADSEVLSIASRVFRKDEAFTPGVVDRRWRVDRFDGASAGVAEKGEWIVTGSSTENDRMQPWAGASRERALLRVEADALDYLLRKSSEAVAVHSALLSRDGCGVVIVGPSLAGKSTLATALWRSGWSLLSDDLAFLDPAKGTAAPAPRRVSLRHGSKDLVGDVLWADIQSTPSCIHTEKGLFFHPHELSDSSRHGETSLTAVFFLARRGVTVAPAETRRINPAKAALALLPYALNVRELPFGEGMRRVGPLCAAAPAYDLGRGDLSDMVKSVEARVA